MEAWEKMIKKRLVSTFFILAMGMMNYIIVSLLFFLSLQAGAPGIVYFFLVTYIVILLAATIRMYKLLNGLRIDLSRGSTESKAVAIHSIEKSRLVVEVNGEEISLYLPKALRNNGKLEVGKRAHVTYLQRSKTVIEVK